MRSLREQRPARDGREPVGPPVLSATEPELSPPGVLRVCAEDGLALDDVDIRDGAKPVCPVHGKVSGWIVTLDGIEVAAGTADGVCLGPTISVGALVEAALDIDTRARLIGRREGWATEIAAPMKAERERENTPAQLALARRRARAAYWAGGRHRRRRA